MSFCPASMDASTSVSRVRIFSVTLFKNIFPSVKSNSVIISNLSFFVLSLHISRIDFQLFSALNVSYNHTTYICFYSSPDVLSAGPATGSFLRTHGKQKEIYTRIILMYISYIIMCCTYL